jgi:hypothetical protein
MMVVNEKYQAYAEYLAGIPERFDFEGETIYTGRNEIKVMKMPEGKLINVKRYHPPRAFNAIVYSTGLRKPKGQRAFEYPERLLSRHIETPEPLAYIEKRCLGLLRESYLITLQCPFPHTMYEMGNAEEGTYEELAAAFADYTAHMHEEGVMHRDYSPGNILWMKEEGARGKDERYLFSVVDINRMFFGQVSMEKGCRNLCRLWGPKRFFQLVVRHYAEKRGFDTDEAERIALKARSAFWKRFGKKHRIKFKLEL